MTDLDLDNLDIQADDTDDDYVRIRKSHLDGVRDAAKSSAKHRKEIEGLRRDKSLAEAGLNDLTDEQRAAVLALVEEPSPDAYRSKAQALGFIAAPPAAPEPTPDDVEAIGRQAQVGAGAGTPTSNQVSPEELNGWPVDRLMRLDSQHPALYESAMRGETIELPPGFA